MIVQNPADPWELYLLRQLSRQSQGISIPRAVGLYDAESKSYLLCSAYPNLSLSQIYQNERLSKALLCFVVAEVLAILENCHACGIIHGALTSDTILLKGTSIHDAGVLLVDFSRGVDTTIHPPGARFKSKTENPWRFEKDTNDLADVLRQSMSLTPFQSLRVALNSLTSIRGENYRVEYLRQIRSDLQRDFSSVELAESLYEVFETR